MLLVPCGIQMEGGQMVVWHGTGLSRRNVHQRGRTAADDPTFATHQSTHGTWHRAITEQGHAGGDHRDVQQSLHLGNRHEQELRLSAHHVAWSKDHNLVID